jgi:hypothetical protein
MFRDRQGAEAEAFIAERSNVENALNTIDCTQTIVELANATRLVPGALQRANGVQGYTTAGDAGSPILHDTSITSNKMTRCISMRSNVSEDEITLISATLACEEDSILFFETSFNVFISQAFAASATNGPRGTPKYCTLRMYFSNNLVQKIRGPADCEPVYFFGVGQVAAGNVKVEITIELPTVASAEPTVFKDGDEVPRFDLCGLNYAFNFYTR